MTILLEGNEQGHLEIHNQLYTMLERKSLSPVIPTTDDRNSR